MIERHIKILELVNKYKKLEVTKLSELIGVSQVTIRKDLDNLVEKGLLHREHGFATIGNSDDLNNRMVINYERKRKIAMKAAEGIEDGETVMIESGSTCAFLAEELAKNKKNITIITNSTFISSYIRDTDCNVIILGGELQKRSQVTVGALTRICARSFCVDKLFVGVDGFTPKFGFTGGDLMRAETVKDMAESANQVIVLTDSSKFRQQGIVSLFSMKEVDSVFTDQSIEPEINALLEANSIQVHIAMD